MPFSDEQNKLLQKQADELSKEHTRLSKDAQEILHIILELLQQNAKEFHPPEFLNDISEFKQIQNTLADIQEFCESIRKGNLEHSPNTRNYSIAQLKAIQMELRNLVWQILEIGKEKNYASSDELHNDSGAFQSIVKHISSTIHELHQSSQTFEKISSHDPLTNYYNRNALKKEFLNAINFAADRGHTCALFLFDLDHFKRINDTYGHTVGDLTLKEFARKIQESIRDSDLCCRLGGEEFVILFPNVAIEFIPNIDERFRKNVAALNVETETGSVSVTFSAGITYFTPKQHIEYGDFEKLLDFADKLLYQAKEAGRNRSIVKEYV